METFIYVTVCIFLFLVACIFICLDAIHSRLIDIRKELKKYNKNFSNAKK